MKFNFSNCYASIHSLGIFDFYGSFLKRKRKLKIRENVNDSGEIILHRALLYRFILFDNAFIIALNFNKSTTSILYEERSVSTPTALLMGSFLFNAIIPNFDQNHFSMQWFIFSLKLKILTVHFTISKTMDKLLPSAYNIRFFIECNDSYILLHSNLK